VSCFSKNAKDEEAASERNFTEIILLFSLGSLFALTFFASLVGLRKKAFERDSNSHKRRKSIHSTMKRILLTHFQTLNTVMALEVPWPLILTQILDGMSTLSGSFGENSVY
jgi:hypothetical protein